MTASFETRLGVRVMRACTTTTRGAYRIALAAVVLLAGIEAVVLALVGAYHVNAFGHDTPVLLDASWRMLQGQIPHLDFHSSLGPVAFLPIVAAMRVVGPNVGALGLASAGLVVLLVTWAWVIARPRMSAALLTIFCLLIGGIVGGAHHLGADFWSTTYGMVYNRLGYAVLAIMMVELLLPRYGEPSSDLSTGVSTGFLTVLLLFLKITYFVVAVGAVIGACLLRLPRRHYARWLTGFAVGAAVCGAVFLAYLHGSIGPMLSDLRLTFVARSSAGQTGLMPLLSSGVANLSSGIVLAIIWFAAMGLHGADAGTRQGGWRLAVALIAVWLIGVALKATNYQGAEVPLYSVMALILLEYAGRFAVADPRLPAA